MKVREIRRFNPYRDNNLYGDDAYFREGCIVGETERKCNNCEWQKQWNVCVLDIEVMKGSELIVERRSR